MLIGPRKLNRAIAHHNILGAEALQKQRHSAILFFWIQRYVETLPCYIILNQLDIPTKDGSTSDFSTKVALRISARSQQQRLLSEWLCSPAKIVESCFARSTFRFSEFQTMFSDCRTHFFFEFDFSRYSSDWNLYLQRPRRCVIYVPL